MEVRPLNFCSNRFECEWGVKLVNQLIIPIVGLDGKMILSWETPINLENGLIYFGVEQYKTPIDGCVSLNRLKQDGVIVCDTHCYDQYEIFVGEKPSFGEQAIEKYIAEFKEHGFNVTEEAILHNAAAWLSDLKSGYRDEKNNYHLFTPCGCNPFRMNATTLFNTDWQITYEC